MTGRAAVLVGKRTLVSYALEPLRQMRESLSVAPTEGVLRPSADR
jgi:hypothetical protein